MCYSPGRKAMSVRTVAIISALCALASATGCTNKKDVEHAKHSLYDTDFAVVYAAALKATRDLYPNLDENPSKGQIQTSWHQVVYAGNQDDLANPRAVGGGGGQPGMGGAGGMGGGPGMGSPAGGGGTPTTLVTKRYFIRFDVSVLGGRPWRVKVIGHASEWEPGAAMPSELHGIARPSWLVPRTESLQVSIYNKIRQWAIPMKEDKVEVEEVVHTDPAIFKDVPDAAAKRLAIIKDILNKRDYAALRPMLADDVLWSLGDGPGADTAMAMWQADPSTFEAMNAGLTAGCAGDAKRVTCPGGEAVSGAFQLLLEPRGAEWKITSFVKAE